METTTYINSFDNFIREENHILIEDNELENANHILILMNNGKDFGFICPSKPTETISGNKSKMEKLQQDVIKLKCSYIPFMYGVSYAGVGESTFRNEDSCLFVQGIKLEELLGLAEKYEQQTVAFGNKDELKSYDVQNGKPDVTLGAVDMKLAMATVLFYPGTFK